MRYGICQLCAVCTWDIPMVVLRCNDPGFPWTMWFFRGKHVQELHRSFRP